MRFAGVLVLLVALGASCAGRVRAEPALAEGFVDTIAIGNLDKPVNFRFASDGRVFVAEQTGKILVFENISDTTPELFADLRTQVYDTGDRGLLGIALDPKFTEGRPYLYALYTYDHILGDSEPAPKWGEPEKSGDPCPDTNGGDACLVSGRLVRLTAVGNQAGPSATNPTQKVLAEGWCQQFSSHSIGDLQFGPEGDLYVSGGDGASFTSADYGQLGTTPNPCGDHFEYGPEPDEHTTLGGSLRAQNLQNLSGKILRVDPETGKGVSGNPFFATNSNENAQRVIASGFRNPFRFTFDPQTNELYTGNVGSSEIEEIDRFPTPPGTLFKSGWPCYEGPGRQFQFKVLQLSVCEALYQEDEEGREPVADPFFYYSHGQSVVPDDECPFEYGSAIGGISFYSGNKFPAAYQGALFFSDPVRGCIWAMFPGADGRPDPNTTIRFLRDGQIYPGVDIEEGPEGNLYYAELFGNQEFAPGAIHKISYAPGAPTARLAASPEYGVTLPLHVTFDAGKSSDPGEEELTYDWDLNNDGTFETKNAGPTLSQDYTEKELEEEKANEESLNKVVAVRVTDGQGLSSVARITVYPGDQPLLATIQSPLESYKWGAGDKITITGLAYDTTKEPKEPIFFPLRYYWSTALLHCPIDPQHCHAHPLQTFAGTLSASFTVPEHDYPSYLEITLRVADGRGLISSKTIKLEPRAVQMTISTDPPGIALNAGLLAGASPLSLTAIEGSNVLFSAPQSAEVGGKVYTFQKWSDGGDRVHTIHVGGTTSYLATYTTAQQETQPVAPAPVPDARIRRHPPSRTTATTAKFVLGATLAGAGFHCKLDRQPFKACRSPKQYKHLKPGRHSFQVTALNSAGEADPTPANFSWRIVKRRSR